MKIETCVETQRPLRLYIFVRDLIQKTKMGTISITKYSRKIIEAQKIVVDKNGDTFLVVESPQNLSNPFNISCSL